MNKIPLVKWHDYVSAIGEGEFVSRAQMARVFQVSTSTAKYNLERAVEAGALVRLPGYIGNQPGYVYALPNTQPELGL